MVFDPNYLLINKIFLVLIIIVTLFLAFWIYFSNRKSKVNQLFFLTSLSFLFWWAGGYFFSFSNNLEFSLWFGRIILGVVSISFALLYFFLVIFPYETKRNKILDRFIVLLVIIFFFFPIVSDSVVEGVKFSDWGIDPIYGTGQIIYYGWIAFIMIVIFIQLFQKYFQIVPEMRIRVQYFFVGFLIFILMNLIFNVFFPIWQDSIKYWQLGNYSALFVLAFTAYAIVRRELFGIRVVLTALLVVLIAILLALDIFAFTAQLSLQFFKGLILVLFLYFGYLLIKSVLAEIKRREELEKLSSELATTNIKLDAAYKKLQKLDKAKSEFISMASHQLRTPLSAIKGYISMLVEGSYGQVSEKAKEKLRNVFQSNERLIKIVNDLLNISKIELGKMELEKAPTNLEGLVQSCYEEMEPEAQKRGLKFTFQKSKKPLPEIEIDSLKIRQAITNLIDNAIRYTQKGEIKIGVEKINSTIQISVEDTGEGLTEEEESKVFEGFTRGSAGISFFIEGAGLGLYVAKKYLELHQGKIWVESQGKGKGSTFYMELPIS